jgi:peroxiredoxin
MDILPKPLLRRTLLIGAALGACTGASAATLATGGPAPDFTLRTLSGSNLRLQEQRGDVVLVNFWATWCAPCRHEIPLLNKIRAERAGKGFEVVGIAVDFADDVRAFTKDFPIGYPLLIGEEDGLEAARAFGVATMAFPFTVFTDAHGRVIAVHLGELHAEQAAAILGIVARVDSGALTPDAARSAVKAALEALPPAREGAPTPGRI